MKIVYAPKDGAPQEFTLRLDEMLSIDSEPLEEVGGTVWQDWDTFKAALAANKGRAKRAILWHFLRQQKPELTFVEVVTGADEITIMPDEEDIRRAREFYLSDAATEEQRAQFLAEFGEGKDEADDGTTDSASPAPASEA